MIDPLPPQHSNKYIVKLRAWEGVGKGRSLIGYSLLIIKNLSLELIINFVNLRLLWANSSLRLN